MADEHLHAPGPPRVSRKLLLGVVVVLAAAVVVALWAGGAGDGGDSSGQLPDESSLPPTGSGRAAAPPVPMRARRISGYVRDQNGHPVPGATVRLEDGGRPARASRTGRFVLRAGPGRHMIVAAARGYARQSVATVLRRGRGARVDFSLAVTAPKRISVANSADRLILWIDCEQVVRLSDAELQGWVDRGVDGFVCQTGRLAGLGGTQTFSAERGEPPQGEHRSLQREILASAALRWARQGRLLLYLGFYAVNYLNRSTPFVDWFDGSGWSQTVLPRVRDLAAAARWMGFAGLAIDQELYPQKDGAQTASWSVSYRGNTHPEAQVRSTVKERGRELMKAMVAGYPGLELLAYGTQIPESWIEKVQADVNGIPNAVAQDVRIDLWDGLSSVQGYSAIRWFDSIFFKTPHVAGASWDSGLGYNANQIYSYLSRRFSNWSYASSRLHVAPFGWVNEGPRPFARARDPGYVAQQLDAFRRWGAGGAYGIFSFGRLHYPEYDPYDAPLRQASTPARVDTSPPKLTFTDPPGSRPRVSAGETIRLEGTASDDFAIRAVRWYDDRGREGVARLTWNYTGDPESGWNGVMSWSIDRLTVPRRARRLTISAEDIHGLASRVQLRVAD
jgi:Carboxypeptidase regulatory-like domain